MVPSIFKLNLYKAYTRMQVSMYDIFSFFPDFRVERKVTIFWRRKTGEDSLSDK